ncbi:hypothetical protein HMI55_003485 [Coelomomyces lativittatus]|nr:hypothetical protein HMI55_003485 [Coelomomyces lativittatus]
MEEVAIDHLIIGPNPQGYQLLVARCTFSGWVEARLVNSTQGELVVDFLREEIFNRHGRVRNVLADSGTTRSRIVREYVEKKGARMQVTLPQNPRGNAVVE